MALHERNENSTIYLEVKYHSLCRVSKTMQPGFKKVTGTNPKTGQPFTKYFYPYDGVDGYVRKVEWYDREDNDGNRYVGYKIHLDADGQPVVIDIAYKTKAFEVFLKVAENIDWTQRLHFSAWHDRQNDSTAFLIRQGDRTGPAIKRKYTRENPGGMPEPKQNPITKKWDFSEQVVWLKTNFDKNVLPRIEQAQSAIDGQVSRRELADAVQAPRPQQPAKSAPEDPFGDFGEPDSSEIPF